MVPVLFSCNGQYIILMGVCIMKPCKLMGGDKHRWNDLQ